MRMKREYGTSNPSGREEAAEELLTIDWMRQAVASLLGCPASAIDDHAEMTRMGLDSVRVMQLYGMVRRAGVEITFSELVERPTIAGWWDLVSPRLGGVGAARPALTIEETEPFDLATMQHAYWIGRSEEQAFGGVGAHFYNEFDGTCVDSPRPAQAVPALVARHGMLRASFLDDGR